MTDTLNQVKQNWSMSRYLSMDTSIKEKSGSGYSITGTDV